MQDSSIQDLNVLEKRSEVVCLGPRVAVWDEAPLLPDCFAEACLA